MVKFLIFITVVIVIAIVIVVTSIHNKKRKRNSISLVYKAYIIELMLNIWVQSDDRIEFDDSFVREWLKRKGNFYRDTFINKGYSSFLKDPSGSRYHVVNKKVLMTSIPKDLEIKVSISKSKLSKVITENIFSLLKDLLSKNDVIFSKNEKKYIKDVLDGLINFVGPEIKIDMSELQGKDHDIDEILKTSSTEIFKNIILKISEKRL